MPKASPIQPTFSGGEFSPKVFGRVDNERYKTGAEKFENFLPTTQGPGIRRPPFKYSGFDVKDPSKPPEFIPFQFSQTQNYILEFGDKYIRFYTNGSRIVLNTTVFQPAIFNANFGSSYPTYTLRDSSLSRPGESQTGIPVGVNSGVLEMRTPYSWPDVANLKFSQKEDTLILTCSTYPTYKLIRSGNISWDLVRIPFEDGPYLPLNSYLSVGDSADFVIQVGTPVVIPSPTGAGPIGYQAVAGPSFLCSSILDNGSGAARVHTTTPHPFQTGQKIVLKGAVGTATLNNGTSTYLATFWDITRINPTSFDLNGSTFAGTFTGSGVVYPYLFQAIPTSSTTATGSSYVWRDTGRNIGLFGANGNRIWGKIAQVREGHRVDINTHPSQPAYVGMSSSLNISLFWQLGAFFEGNHPSASCFHQDRLGFGGTPVYPQRVDLSETSFYESFAPSNSSLTVADNNAISFNLAANQLNKINWLKSDTQGLLAGSVSSEWNITPNNQAAALSPTNVSAKQTSFFGSHDADAVQTGNATIYIQRSQRRVRELNYFFQVDTYRSTDIAELADHLMLPGLVKLVNQKESIPVVWSYTTEGKLRSMTYSRDDAALKVGWAPHKLGGQSDSSGTAPVIKTMATIPSPDGTFDQLWCAVQRFINGTCVVSVEFTGKMFDDNTLQDEYACLDMSATYDVPIAVTNITRAGSAVVTAAGHNLTDGDEVVFKKVVGLNSSFTDSMGVTFNSNLVNGRIFRAGSTSANEFFLQDISNGSSYIDSRSYSSYFSGGEVRKLVSTISGLTWLKNETVSVLADGKVHNNVTVNSGGFFSLDFKAAIVHVGYGYNSDGKTLRPEAGAADGTSIGKLRRVHKAAFMLHKTGDLSIGPSFERLTPVVFPSLNAPQADVAQPLFSGIVRDSVASEHDFDGQICFRMSSPLPGMVQSITKMLEENDV